MLIAILDDVRGSFGPMPATYGQQWDAGQVSDPRPRY